MSRHVQSKTKSRHCLVCSDSTRIAHLGIDVCRACAVFYRRAKRGNDYSCRSGAESCSGQENVRACKRCRFEKLTELLSFKSAKIAAKTRSLAITNSSDTPLLSRLHAEYKSMCFAQLSSELHARADAPHPMRISLGEGPFYPADFAALTLANRVILTASLQFGTETFPEFASLHESDKWVIVKNFMYPFRILEGSYRSNKVFPNEPLKYFSSYATYFDAASNTNFFGTALQTGDVHEAERYLHSPEFAGTIPEAREAMKRVAPTHEEFLALVCLTFWKIEGLSVSEEAIQAGARYREAILKELHVVYRTALQIHDYAARLGELMLLLENFEKTRAMHQHFEVFRLYNVLPDDNFADDLHRED